MDDEGDGVCSGMMRRWDGEKSGSGRKEGALEVYGDLGNLMA